MKKTILLAVCGVATMAAGSAIAGQPAIVANPSGQAVGTVSEGLQTPAGVLYDNGPWDNINGYSAILGGAFDLDRSLLDDFTVPAGGWDIGGAATQYIWNLGGIGSGSDLLITFMADGGSCNPTTVVATTTSTSYTETDLGFQAFGREAVLLEVTFATLHLDPGHYWIKMEPVFGTDDSGFILTAVQNDCASWVDYADFGGLQPGINIFGVDSDVTFTINGVAVPACLSMTVSPLVAGDFATWDVSGATPGSRVAVVNGFGTGSTVLNDVSGFCVTFGIDGITTNSLVGSAIADGGGLVSITRHILKNLTGITVLTQAAQNGTCGGDDCKSDIDEQVIG